MTGTEDDVALRIVHTADWHLGRRFPGFAPAAARKLTQARLEAVRNVLDLAEPNMADAILCAGDLFDNEAPPPEWYEPLADLLNKAASAARPIVLLPGNHDPFIATSAYWRGHPFRKALSSHVHVVDRDDFELSVGRESEGVVYATPCKAKAGQHDVASHIPKREAGDDRIRIGLLHGSTYKRAHFPIPTNLVLDRGLDYLALGDHHGYEELRAEPDAPPTVYPGPPEPTTFGESDAGFAVLVRFNRKRIARIDRRPVARWTWERKAVASLDELDRLRGRKDLERRVLQLVINMRLGIDDHRRAKSILSELEGDEARPGRVGVLDLDDSGLKLDTDDIGSHFDALPDSIRSAAIRLQNKEREADSEQDREIARRALLYLLDLVGSAG